MWPMSRLLGKRSRCWPTAAGERADEGDLEIPETR